MKISTLMLLCVAAFAWDPAVNPLSSLPSAPGAHLASIDSLGDNSWLSLGSPVGDPVWGKPNGRAWSPKMPYAADLRGAFNAGEGPHSGLKPDGHFQDDLFFYDVNQNRWICLWPGTPVHGADLHLNADSLEVDGNGYYYPIDFLGHGYNLQTYDPHRRAFVSEILTNPYWNWQERIDWLTEGLGPDYDRSACYDGCLPAPIKRVRNLLFWCVDSNQWTRAKVTDGSGPSLDGAFESVVEYLPTLRKTFYYSRQGSFLYDATANHWDKAADPSPYFSYDINGCRDTRRERLYMLRMTQMAYYDIAGNTWTNLAPANMRDFETSASCTFQYDSTGDAILALLHGGTRPGVYAYDISTDAWFFIGAFPFDPGNADNNCFHTFYDPALNAHFLYTARDGYNEVTRMWAYRYKSVESLRRERETTGLTLLADQDSLEKYLSLQLRFVRRGPGFEDTLTCFASYTLTALDTAAAVVDPTGRVLARETGVARIVLGKNNITDTLVLTVKASTASLDSIRVSPAENAREVGASCAFSATGFYHKDSVNIILALDTMDVDWSSSDTSRVSIDADGLCQVRALGEPVTLTASFGGRSATALLRIWPRMQFVRRINFQVTATPFTDQAGRVWRSPDGWLADNGTVYSALKGWGWTTASVTPRDDRAGLNFLLKSFVIGSPSNYRIDAPDGRYIIKTAMGDNTYGTAAYNWTAFGADTIVRKPAGMGNAITVDTIEITGGYAGFAVNGPVNYLVMISDEGVDINRVADDGDTTGLSGAAVSAGTLGVQPRLSAAPNPFSGGISIGVLGGSAPFSVTVFDIRGRMVAGHVFGAGERTWTWKPAALPAGLYLVKACGRDITLVRKVLYQK